MYICSPGHRVSRARGTGSVGDGVGEGVIPTSALLQSFCKSLKA